MRDRRRAQLEQKISDSSTFEGIVGRAMPMVDLLTKVRRIAPHFSTALVTGETGTGKELVSRALHSWSCRQGPFIVCNCASVVGTLFESELFGHKRGSFTGAISDKQGLVDTAEGGTLFLDELGEVPLEIQAKLLRLLQNRDPVARPLPQHQPDRAAPMDPRSNHSGHKTRKQSDSSVG